MQKRIEKKGALRARTEDKGTEKEYTAPNLTASGVRL